MAALLRLRDVVSDGGFVGTGVSSALLLLAAVVVDGVMVGAWSYSFNQQRASISISRSWDRGGSYGAADNADVALACQLQDLASAGSGLFPEVAEAVVAFEMQVFVFMAQDVLRREPGDLEPGLFVEPEEFGADFICEGGARTVVVRVDLGGVGGAGGFRGP